MSLENSYFAIKNPLLIIEQWLNPTRHQLTLNYHGKDLTIRWTERANRALLQRSSPLVVEMQIYFSCVVQKRVLFHEQTDYATEKVNDLLEVVLRPVEAESCDPVEFAKNHPVANEYTSTAAKKFHPKQLELDFKDKRWSGSFSI